MMIPTPIPIDEKALRSELHAYRPPTVPVFSHPDRYLAMSVLQKSIRRNELELALSAGSFLREVYPNQFWQRLRIIALEDIGLADLDLVGQVLLISSEPQAWGVSGGMQQASSFLIERLCTAQKDRSTDDLFDVLSRDPGCANNCVNLADNSDTVEADNLRTSDVFERALSLIPPNQRDGVFPDRLTRTEEWVFMIEQAGFEASSSVTSVACLAARATRSILAPMLVALAPEIPEKANETNDDVLPTLWHRDIPTWACGQHTRVGLAGLRAYAARSQRVAKLLRDGKTGEISTAKILGGLLFRIECGQLHRRIDWKLGSDLKNRATRLGWGVRDDVVTNLLGTMVEEWDLLNECRLAALQNHFR